MDYQSPMNQSRGKTMYVALVIAVLVLLGVAAWYLSGSRISTPAPSAVQQSQLPAISGGNTTADIAGDLSQIPDDSTALNQDLNSLNQEVKSF